MLAWVLGDGRASSRCPRNHRTKGHDLSGSKILRPKKDDMKDKQTGKPKEGNTQKESNPQHQKENEDQRISTPKNKNEDQRIRLTYQRIRTPEEGKRGTGTDARKTRRVEAILERDKDTGY
jgi:hypothetical protein